MTSLNHTRSVETMPRWRVSAQRAEEIRTGLIFIAPALIFMLLLVGYPVIYNFILGFQNVTAFNLATGAERRFVGLDNYISLFQTPTMWIAIRNSLFFTFVCLVFQFSIGLAFAILFNKKFALARHLRGFLVITWMMPITVTALLFRYMLSAEVGIFDAILMGIGITSEPIGWLVRNDTAIWGPILANIWIGIPFNMLLLTTGLASIPEEIYESASIDGAGPWQRFVWITIPLLRPAMLAVLVLGFVYTFKVFDLIFVMTGGGPVNATEVLSTLSYRESFSFFNFSRGAAVANVLFIILFLVGLIYLKLIKTEEAS